MIRYLIWSFLLTLTIEMHAQTVVTQVEYFLDADLGVGMNTVLEISSSNEDITETILADIPSSVAVGFHKLYLRVKDENGHWSQTSRKNIEVVSPLMENNVITGEYFIDTEPEIGLGNTFQINPQETEIDQAFTAQISEAATIGYHKLYVRVKDAYGNWSLTFRKNIEVYLNPMTTIVEIEYFFDMDLEFGNNTIVVMDDPIPNGTRNFYVPYPSGSYDFEDILFLRAKDNHGKWSITSILDEIDEELNVNDMVLNNSIKIHPNPVDSQLRLTSSNKFIVTETSIYDLTGKKVFYSSKNLNQMDLTHLQCGIYILQLNTDLGTANFKIVKQN